MNPTDNETRLWAWFLFNAGLTPQRAKTLLTEWEQHGLTLSSVLERLPAQADMSGLTPDEAIRLRPPHELPDVHAVRWNEPLYPLGLHHLPLKLRPALLFYTGEASLLLRPIIYLVPGPLDAATRELLQETVSLLLGENLLPATFRESPQAELLLEEMAISEGEALLFAREGLAQLMPSEREQAFLQAGRLLILSPLPPSTRATPALNEVLQQVAASAALRRVHTHAATLPDDPAAAAGTLLLTATAVSRAPHGIPVAESAVEALTWLTEIPLPPTPTSQPAAEPLYDAPPPTPEEALRVLEKGGRVPEVLKKRLLGV
ncbi:MAG TPA: hypothetical protein PLJ78_14705 [Anaerolineae bacterium]|nr:hypothetical protein [Anaerolineae bacterium]HQK15181.1 hypothetical protein [Anaerolineae bacterium]